MMPDERKEPEFPEDVDAILDTDYGPNNENEDE